MLKRIDHVGVVVDDLTEARRLLEETLGLSLTKEQELPEKGWRGAFYRCGEIDIELITLSRSEERAERLGDAKARIEHIAIQVDALPQALPALLALGLQTTAEPEKIGPRVNVWTRPQNQWRRHIPVLFGRQVETR